jgi:hypothetical protein
MVRRHDEPPRMIHLIAQEIESLYLVGTGAPPLSCCDRGRHTRAYVVSSEIFVCIRRHAACTHRYCNPGWASRNAIAARSSGLLSDSTSSLFARALPLLEGHPPVCPPRGGPSVLLRGPTSGSDSARAISSIFIRFGTSLGAIQPEKARTRVNLLRLTNVPSWPAPSTAGDDQAVFVANLDDGLENRQGHLNSLANAKSPKTQQSRPSQRGSRQQHWHLKTVMKHI